MGSKDNDPVFCFQLLKGGVGKRRERAVVSNKDWKNDAK